MDLRGKKDDDRFQVTFSSRYYALLLQNRVQASNPTQTCVCVASMLKALCAGLLQTRADILPSRKELEHVLSSPSNQGRFRLRVTLSVREWQSLLDRVAPADRVGQPPQNIVWDIKLSKVITLIAKGVLVVRAASPVATDSLTSLAVRRATVLLREEVKLQKAECARLAATCERLQRQQANRERARHRRLEVGFDWQALLAGDAGDAGPEPAAPEPLQLGEVIRGFNMEEETEPGTIETKVSARAKHLIQNMGVNDYCITFMCR